MAIIKTLKTTTNDTEQSVYPKTVLEAVVDSETNETLDVILDNIKSDTPNGSAYVDFNEQSGEVTGEVEAVTSAKLVSYSNTESGIEATNVQDAIDTVSSISKGKNRARVFATTEDMNNWLKNEANKGIANVGDNLYIVELDVPDYWISAVLNEADASTGMYYNIAQLETQKVDLTTIESSINNIETSLITGINTTGKDFNNLGNKSFIGTGNGMTNDPINNLAARYLVQHICAGGRITQYAKLINWSNGELNYFRQLNEDNTWSVWSRIAIGYDITTINDSITTMNNSINTIANRVNSIHDTFYLGGGVKTVDIKMTGGSGAIVQGYAFGSTGIDGTPFSLMIRRSNDWSTIKVTSLTDHSESGVTAIPSETSGYITLDLSPVSSWGYIKGIILYLV